MLVTLPLWVLSVTFHHLLPVAVASLLIPVGVCVAAGVQAALPRRTNALVVASAGGAVVLPATDRARLGTLPEPAAIAPAGAASARVAGIGVPGHRGDVLGEVHYWAEKRIERPEYVAELIHELDRRGWPNRSDIGWSEYDVEIYGNRWTNLQLTTVAEDHPRKRQLIRCRLRSRWSLLARLVFWAVAGLDLVALGLWGLWLHWLALPVLTLAPLAYFFHRQKRAQQSVTIVLLDGLAKKLGLLKIPLGEAAKNLQSLTPRAEKGSEPGPAPAQ